MAVEAQAAQGATTKAGTTPPRRSDAARRRGSADPATGGALTCTLNSPAREPARKLMIAVFQLLPPDSELAADYRRRLSFAL